MADPKNLTESLGKLEEIVKWFDEQEEVDVEEGLTKVKAAASLIKDSKTRLAEIENEFQVIEKEINDGETVDDVVDNKDETPINPSDIPF
jgi:exonuclease VII small subunit